MGPAKPLMRNIFRLQDTLLFSAFLPMAAAFSPVVARRTTVYQRFSPHALRRSAGELAISSQPRQPPLCQARTAGRILEAKMMATGSSPPSGVEAGKSCVSEAGRFSQYLVDSAENAIPIDAVAAAEYDQWLAKQDAACKTWIEAMGFTANPTDSGTTLMIPGPKGISKVLLIVGDSDGYGAMYAFSGLPASLPKKAGTFKLASLGGCPPTQAALGFALGAYKFDKYKGSSKPVDPSKPAGNDFAKIVWPEGADKAYVTMTAQATFLVRDLISTPSEDMGPAALQAATEALARLHPGATVMSIVGDDLLKENYPQIHAVGRAADSKHAPRLVELRWSGGKNGKKVTLVGKGITFDTGVRTNE
jgi:hypothetical protein